MKKILITGSSGLVGMACVDLFTEKKWDVVGIDANMRHKFFDTPSKEYFENVDIRDEAHINGLFIAEGPFDVVIHAAAQPSHDYSTDHIIEDFEINARGTLNLLEAARKYCPEAVFIYVSTDKVYGENMSTYSVVDDKLIPAIKETKSRYDWSFPFDEKLGLDFAGHRSFFGCSKLAADLYAQEYANEFGMKIGIFRPGCITGKNHEGAEQHGFLAYLTKCIKNGTTYKIFGNGKNVRDQIHANDLATAFAVFIREPRAGAIYNLGGGSERSVSILEAGELVSKEVNKPFLYELHEARKGDRRWDVHDVSKFRNDYPEWDYKYSLDDIIKDICAKEL